MIPYSQGADAASPAVPQFDVFDTGANNPGADRLASLYRELTAWPSTTGQNRNYLSNLGQQIMHSLQNGSSAKAAVQGAVIKAASSGLCGGGGAAGAGAATGAGGGSGLGLSGIGGLCA